MKKQTGIILLIGIVLVAIFLVPQLGLFSISTPSGYTFYDSTAFYFSGTEQVTPSDSGIVDNDPLAFWYKAESTCLIVLNNFDRNKCISGGYTIPSGSSVNEEHSFYGSGSASFSSSSNECCRITISTYSKNLPPPSTCDSSTFGACSTLGSQKCEDNNGGSSNLECQQKGTVKCWIEISWSSSTCGGGGSCDYGSCSSLSVSCTPGVNCPTKCDNGKIYECLPPSLGSCWAYSGLSCSDPCAGTYGSCTSLNSRKCEGDIVLECQSQLTSKCWKDITHCSDGCSSGACIGSGNGIFGNGLTVSEFLSAGYLDVAKSLCLDNCNSREGYTVTCDKKLSKFIFKDMEKEGCSDFLGGIGAIPFVGPLISGFVCKLATSNLDLFNKLNPVGVCVAEPTGAAKYYNQVLRFIYELGVPRGWVFPILIVALILLIILIIAVVK